MRCKICNNINDNKVYKVKEMMLGLREEFVYFQCSICECLQIEEVPGNIEKYYPSNYYSFLSPSSQELKNIFIKILKKLRAKYIMLNRGIFGKLIYNYFPDTALKMLSLIKPNINNSILDIGCGNGTLLHTLKEIGFKNLLGADPYIKEDIQYKNGLKIIKKSVQEINTKWDIIMLHHSFEHLPNPIEIIQTISELLNDKGTCLIRVPTPSSYAWEHYRENWVQLDAPRHFFLHSVKSIELLAEKAGLKIEKIIYDSTDFQFWGSEQYTQDIPLTSSNSYLMSPSNSIFSMKEIRQFKRQASKLNQNNRGDTCAFFLKKKTN